MVIVFQQGCNRHIVATGTNEKYNVSIGEIKDTNMGINN